MANPLEALSAHLAKNVAGLREQRRLTQGQLARLAGIPRSTLTYVESGNGNPSLVNLVRLSQALQVTIEELLAPPRHTTELIRYADLPVTKKGGGLAKVMKLIPGATPGIILERMEIAPKGRLGGVPHLSGTKEYFTCLSGEIELTVAGKAHCLAAGDLLAFPGDQPHSYYNPGSKTLVGISVVALVS